MSSQKSRRADRIRALAALYALHFNAANTLPDLEKFFKLCPSGDNDPGTVEEAEIESPTGFAWDLVLGVWSHQQDLDKIIAELSQNWKLERIAPLDLSILRMAVFEMLFLNNIPVKVAINEAVELAKKYSDHMAPGFINGILDSVAKLKAGEK